MADRWRMIKFDERDLIIDIAEAEYETFFRKDKHPTSWFADILRTAFVDGLKIEIKKCNNEGESNGR